jgi:hypothetical protein
VRLFFGGGGINPSSLGAAGGAGEAIGCGRPGMAGARGDTVVPVMCMGGAIAGCIGRGSRAGSTAVLGAGRFLGRPPLEIGCDRALDDCC